MNLESAGAGSAEGTIGELWLVMAFDDRLLAALTPTDPGDQFDMRGVRYLSQSGPLSVFVDRLLDGDGKLIGMAFEEVPESIESFTSTLKRRSYLQVSRNRSYFEVYLGGKRVEAGARQPDQAFGGRFYKSTSGIPAISVDVRDLLNVAEQQELRSASAVWTSDIRTAE